MKLGEFELISRIKSLFSLPEDVLGIGDDCAVIPRGDGSDLLVSTDLLVEGVHFLLEDIPAADLGWKAAAVNFSDIAAMGGSPQGSFLSIALPSGITDEWIRDFMEGYREMSESVGAPLLGGDTTRSLDRLCINVTVLGACGHGKAVLRSGARTGDLICVTGNLGDSAAGLHIVLSGVLRRSESNNTEPAGSAASTAGSASSSAGIASSTAGSEPAGSASSAAGSAGLAAGLVRSHYRPVPRVAEGQALAESGAHSMMDISDGIGSDLEHILEASGKGAVIFTDRLPISPALREFCEEHGLDAFDLAVNGGEDYELLFTIGPEDESCLQIEHHVIGTIVEGEGIRCEGRERHFHGFRHF